jgi:thiol-disulfide isomerase/thioredoxin
MNRNWLYVVLFLIFAFTAFYFYHRGTTAPSLQLQELHVSDLNEQPFDWRLMEGRKTLICFGASWCGECRRELENLQKLLANELNGLQVVVVSDEPYEKIRAYKQKYQYPFMFLKLQRPFSEHGIYSVPTNYLLNKKLKVVKEKIGDFNWEDASTREHLLTLMDN